MIEMTIPGFGKLELEYLIVDYNGTLAQDGDLLPGVAGVLGELSREIDIHVVTADTLGIAEENLAEIPVTIHVIKGKPEDEAKLDYLEELGPEKCVCIGNGVNDALVLERARVSIGVVGREAAALRAVAAAQLVAPDIITALNLFRYPLRLLATLRN